MRGFKSHSRYHSPAPSAPTGTFATTPPVGAIPSPDGSTRTKIVYLDTRFDWLPNLLVILAARDAAFPRTKIPMHKVRWVRTSSTGGYWTT